MELRITETKAAETNGEKTQQRSMEEIAVAKAKEEAEEWTHRRLTDALAMKINATQ